MLSQLHKGLEVHGEHGVSQSGDSNHGVLDKRGSSEWWLKNFGIYVEPNTDCFVTGGGGVISYKVWERRHGIDVFSIGYGNTIGKLWIAMREMVK